jgi:hypothetical protein
LSWIIESSYRGFKKKKKKELGKQKTVNCLLSLLLYYSSDGVDGIVVVLSLVVPVSAAVVSDAVVEVESVAVVLPRLSLGVAPPSIVAPSVVVPVVVVPEVNSSVLATVLCM